MRTDRVAVPVGCFPKVWSGVAANGTVAGAPNTRARQRALAIGVVTGAPGDDDELVELGELLRTAGVATAGTMVQQRSELPPEELAKRIAGEPSSRFV